MMPSLRILLFALLLGGVAVAVEPHPDALPNTHAPGEVDDPRNVPFVVKDPTTLPGLVLDETDAVLQGDWQYSTHTPPYVGIGYLHDRREGKGRKSVTWHPEISRDGAYEVRVSFCVNERRTSSAPVTVRHRGGETVVRVNQQVAPLHGRLFQSVGIFDFRAGRSGSVTISNEGTEGKYVIADAVQLLAVESTRAAEFGRLLFSDTTLSHPPGQGCISCHQPATAFADPRRVSPGSVPGRVGTRNAPSLMYAALIPSLVYEDFFNEFGQEEYAWEGGLFHDGRARDQFEQIQEPFFNPNEMNIPDEAALAERLRATGYSTAFREWVGKEAWRDDARLTYHAYRALVEFLKEPLFRPFDARIDDYLAGDEDALDEAEKRGLVVFREAGKCADCHLLEPKSWPRALLSDYGYDNLGVPALGPRTPGLGGTTGEAEELGQFRAPSLRNVELTAPYMHNGSIGTLQEVMEFYNKRDLEPERWGKPHYPETVNRDDLGDLQLTDQQVADLVALMSAFTDRSLLTEEVRKGALPVPPDDVPSTGSRRLWFPDWTHRLHPVFREHGTLP